MITTPVILELQHITVNNLLRPEENGWDLDVIMDIFSEQDVAKIMRIPHSRNVGADSWFWLDDDKGTYTVKSRYKHQMSGINSSAINQVDFN